MTDPDHPAARAEQSAMTARDAAKAAKNAKDAVKAAKNTKDVAREAARAARHLARADARDARRLTRNHRTSSDLSPEILGEAALAVLEEEGYDQLSMRKVAERIGIRAPSLYWHVRNKEELLDLASDALAGGFDAALPSGDWCEQIYTLAHRYHEYLRLHGESVRLLGRFVPGPRTARVLENVMRVLREAGFSPREAAHGAYLVFFVYVQGCLTQELLPMNAVEAMGGTQEDAVGDLRQRLEALPADEYPTIRDSINLLTTLNLDSRFEFGLQRILDGLRQQLERAATAKGTSAT